MGKLIPLAVIALAVVWALSFFSAEATDARSHRNYMQSQRDMLALERAETWNELNQQHAPIIATGQTVLALGSMAVFLAAMAGLTLALWHWAQGIQHDKRYQMAQLRSQERVLVAQAAHQHPLPAQHYAPHVTLSYGTSKAIPGDTATVPDEHAPTATVPSFAELLQGGRVGKGNPLLLGYDQSGAAIEGTWLHLYSVGIGGATGSGKSWTAAYLLAQSMLHGARALVIDPHAGDPESLATRLSPLQAGMMSEPASDPRAILATVQMVQSELDRRKSSRTHRVPWVVVADEFSALMRGELQEPLALLIESIAQEGRKLGIYAMCLGQNWKTTRAGGGELRDSLASAFVHRIRPNQARYLTGLYADDLPRDLLELPPGCAYWLSTGGDLQRMTIPQCTSADLHQVAGLLSDQAPTMPRVVSSNGHNGASDETDMTPERNRDDTASVNGSQPLTSDEALIAQLFYAEGLEIGEIVERVTGKKLKGAAYQNAARPIQAAIRKAGNLQAKVVGG